MSIPTRNQFVRALNEIGLPSGRQQVFLREHANAPGRALTARRLAESVHYQNYGGINLQYGLLAKRIGQVLGRQNSRLSILVDFVQPRAVTNSEWVLVMHPQFAEALEQAGWI